MDLLEASYENWHDGEYKPTPTIIEAARALYNGHSVEEISRSESGHDNLSVTSRYVLSQINLCKALKQKHLFLVTGVPGSGKTLAGLNLATEAMKSTNKKEGAVFLSGNGPLVAVLQEALARDKIARSDSKIRKKDALRETTAFIQIIHRWRDEHLSIDRVPEERIAIFDEAQRTKYNVFYPIL